MHKELLLFQKKFTMPPGQKMEGGKPIAPGNEELSFEQRRENAQKYHEENGLPIPDWLKDAN